VSTPRRDGTTGSATPTGLSPKVAAALGRYKVMAVVVGLGLLVLTLEVVLHYGFDDDSLAWWSPIHGVLYMLYLVATADLGMKDRWSIGRMVAVMLAGVVPFFSFVMERKVARQVEGRAADTLDA
jgi:integral membrane protein